MSLCVLVGVVVGLAGGSWWVRSILVDEERYLRAVRPLAGSPRVAQLAGRATAVACRHHAGWRRGLSPRTARLVGLATRRAMGTRTFDRAWNSGHRWLHRGRGGDPRIAAAMIALAVGGRMVGAGALVASVRPRRASS